MSAAPPKPQAAVADTVAVRQPVMRVNRYDRISAGMIATVLSLVACMVVVIAWWLSTRPPRREFLRPMEMMPMTGEGGVEDGRPEDSLKVDSPYEENDNPSAVEDAIDDVMVTSVTEVFESSAGAAQIAEFGTRESNLKLAPESTGALGVSGGRPGSSHGTGDRRGLGHGPGPGGGGIANDQRWFITFGDEVSLREYAQQLDFFGIELGALLPDGKLIYLSRMSQPAPLKREATSGKDEQRMYMTWRGGNRKEADAKILQAIGVNPSQAVIFHFYPQRTEQLLLTLEYQHEKLQAHQIRRTYFSVVKQGTGYEFVVVRQVPLR